MKLKITSNADELKRLFMQLEYTLKQIQEFELQLEVDADEESLEKSILDGIKKDNE